MLNQLSHPGTPYLEFFASSSKSTSTGKIFLNHHSQITSPIIITARCFIIKRKVLIYILVYEFVNPSRSNESRHFPGFDSCFAKHLQTIRHLL